MLTINKFINEYAFLSNFYTAPFYLNKKRYASVEHAYQAHKTLDQDIHEMIRLSSSSVEAKKLGHKIKAIREDWKDVKLDLMKIFIKEKFKNPLLRHQLIETGDAKLIHGNSWNDKFFGVTNGVGLNHLGEILMNERECVKLEQAKIDSIFS